MRRIAVFGALIPWILFAIMLYAKCTTSIDGLGSLGILWLFVSPAWFAFGCLAAYREGQWSKK